MPGSKNCSQRIISIVGTCQLPTYNATALVTIEYLKMATIITHTFCREALTSTKPTDIAPASHSEYIIEVTIAGRGNDLSRTGDNTEKMMKLALNIRQ